MQKFEAFEIVNFVILSFEIVNFKIVNFETVNFEKVSFEIVNYKGKRKKYKLNFVVYFQVILKIGET